MRRGDLAVGQVRGQVEGKFFPHGAVFFVLLFHCGAAFLLFSAIVGLDNFHLFKINKSFQKYSEFVLTNHKFQTFFAFTT